MQVISPCMPSGCSGYGTGCNIKEQAESSRAGLDGSSKSLADEMQAMLNRILTGESGGAGKAGKKKKGKKGRAKVREADGSEGGTEPAAAVKPAAKTDDDDFEVVDVD